MYLREIFKITLRGSINCCWSKGQLLKKIQEKKNESSQTHLASHPNFKFKQFALCISYWS